MRQSLLPVDGNLAGFGGDRIDVGSRRTSSGSACATSGAICAGGASSGAARKLGARAGAGDDGDRGAGLATGDRSGDATGAEAVAIAA